MAVGKEKNGRAQALSFLHNGFYGSAHEASPCDAASGARPAIPALSRGPRRRSRRGNRSAVTRAGTEVVVTLSTVLTIDENQVRIAAILAKKTGAAHGPHGTREGDHRAAPAWL